MQLLIPASTITGVLAGFEALGMDTDAMLSTAGLHRHHLEDPYAAVPDEIFGEIWAAAFARDPQPDLPTRAGFATPFGAFGLIDHLIASARTVGEGLYTLQVFFQLLSATVKLAFTHGDADHLWIENTPRAATDPISDQWTLALIVQRFTNVVERFAVEQVYLTQPPVILADVFAAHFNVPVLLGQPCSGLRLAPGVWQMHLSGTDFSLHTTLRNLAGRVEVQAFAEDPLGYAIRTRLPEAIRTGHYSAEAIAQSLDLPLRTLQRRLTERKMTFRHLLDSYRREEALQMLQQGDQSLAEIAYALGYNEQSSFNRAFKRWTGTTPTTWDHDIRNLPAQPESPREQQP